MGCSIYLSMYSKRENMPEHFAFCAFKGSGAAEDVPYVEGVKQLEGSLAELKVAEVADVVEPHPSLEHPIAGYQLVIVPCDAPSAPPPEADVEADAFTATNASGVDLASVTDKSVAGKT